MFHSTHSNVLVDTQWVIEHLNDPNVRLVESGMTAESYNAGHIPGAVFWSATDLLLPNYQMNLEPMAFEKLLARSGITNDTIVVTYGDYPAIGGWLFWLLKLFGHGDVRVLNGGRHKWLTEDRPLTKEVPTIVPTHYQAKAPNASLRALCDDVKASIDRTKRVLVDARTPQEYSGEWFMMKPPQGTERAGHIPGALWVNYELTLNEDGTFKSIEELQALYSAKGITADKEIIPYCAVGARSAHTWFVLKYLLGYPNVRNYDGSWNEWSRMPEIAIAR
ncbi:MAG TPA: sulfurtransferase [Cyanobacteria bacterium UBA11372]|nr:sulfurtransferase [Cyanobacteria bacterium UBA11372]